MTKSQSTIIFRAIHDIRTPLICLSLLADDTEIPVEQQLQIKSATTRINAIINEVSGSMGGYITQNLTIQPFMPTNALLDILTEKRYEYAHLNIEFTHKIAPEVNGLQIKGDINSFQRMLSNLINNAVDAHDPNNQLIRIDLALNMVSTSSTTSPIVELIIKDNGSGMPLEVQRKILKNISVTYGKVNGHGIGFGQINETLLSLGGKLFIKSAIGHGTQIIIHIPSIQI